MFRGSPFIPDTISQVGLEALYHSWRDNDDRRLQMFERLWKMRHDVEGLQAE